MTGIVPAAIDCFLIGMNVRPQRVENAGRLRVLQRGQRDALQRPLVNMRVGRVAIAAHSGWKSLFFLQPRRRVNGQSARNFRNFSLQLIIAISSMTDRFSVIGRSYTFPDNSALTFFH
ncbi:hypothetical protein LGM90_14800 [Burkholderia sp. AU28942]|uniref:hypothetical protein n=1 Tax=Burkholderia TaxID=32008 RepID=UPI0012E9B0AD|nr:MULTISPECIES: hypothetical protein [Burkholderia]MCA8309780.1 hypothetical protein [Burkholderia sp. AU28942]